MLTILFFFVSFLFLPHFFSFSYSFSPSSPPLPPPPSPVPINVKLSTALLACPSYNLWKPDSQNLYKVHSCSPPRKRQIGKIPNRLGHMPILEQRDEEFEISFLSMLCKTGKSEKVPNEPRTMIMMLQFLQL